MPGRPGWPGRIMARARAWLAAVVVLPAALLAALAGPGAQERAPLPASVELPAQVPRPLSFVLVNDGQTIVLSAPFGGAGSTDESVWMLDVRTIHRRRARPVRSM